MGGGGGGQQSGGGGMSAAEFNSRMAQRDAEWQAEIAKRDTQWTERVSQERSNVLAEQKDAAYQAKVAKPAGKVSSDRGGSIQTSSTSQALGEDDATALDIRRKTLLGA